MGHIFIARIVKMKHTRITGFFLTLWILFNKILMFEDNPKVKICQQKACDKKLEWKSKSNASDRFSMLGNIPSYHWLYKGRQVRYKSIHKHVECRKWSKIKK